MEQALRPPPHAPLSDSDLSTARAAEPLPKGLARKEYFEARNRTHFWCRRASRAALDYMRAWLRLENVNDLIRLKNEALEATQTYEDCIGHFNNAQANYRAVGGKV